jgi:hypothetical protein
MHSRGGYFVIVEISSNILIYRDLEIAQSLAWQLLYPGWNLPKKAPGEHGRGLHFKLARIKAGQDV